MELKGETMGRERLVVMSGLVKEITDKDLIQGACAWAGLWAEEANQGSLKLAPISQLCLLSSAPFAPLSLLLLLRRRWPTSDDGPITVYLVAVVCFEHALLPEES